MLRTTPQTSPSAPPASPRRRARIALTTALVGVTATALAACGQQDSPRSADAGKVKATTADAAYTPTKLAAPGTDIPTAKVDLSMTPFADDTLAVIPMKLGWFKDVGIEIGPTPTGAKLNLNENPAPLLSGQVQAGSAVYEVLLSKMDSFTNVRPFLIHGAFEGVAFFAPKDSGAKSVDELVKGGMTFDAAVAAAMQQFKGKKISLSDDPATQLFYSLVFDLSKTKPSDFKVSRLGNPDIVNLALADRTDLASPSGGPQIVELGTDPGMKQILTEQQVLEATKDSRRLGLVSHSAYVVTDKFYKEHYDTVLRMASAIFRASDLVRKDHKASAAAQLPFLNSYAGSKLTEADLAVLQGAVSHERTFDEMGVYYDQPGTFNVFTSGAAQIKQLTDKGVLKQPHTVSEIDGAKQVWEDLKMYRAKSDELFKSKADGDPAVIKKARALYDARDYLDSYRFLATL